MARIKLTEAEQLPPFLREMHDGAPTHDWPTRHCARVFAQNPDLLESYLGFYYPWHRNDGVGFLEARLKELVRLRIATLNGCKTCKTARLDPDVTEEEAVIGVDAKDYVFSERERAAIDFAEKMAIAHHDIDDEDIAILRQHFSEAEVLELTMMAGQYIGFGRMLAILQLEEAPHGMQHGEHLLGGRSYRKRG